MVLRSTNKTTYGCTCRKLDAQRRVAIMVAFLIYPRLSCFLQLYTSEKLWPYFLYSYSLEIPMDFYTQIHFPSPVLSPQL